MLGDSLDDAKPVLGRTRHQLCSRTGAVKRDLRPAWIVMRVDTVFLEQMT
jgi:hypothetical protein